MSEADLVLDLVASNFRDSCTASTRLRTASSCPSKLSAFLKVTVGSCFISERLCSCSRLSPDPCRGRLWLLVFCPRLIRLGLMVSYGPRLDIGVVGRGGGCFVILDAFLLMDSWCLMMSPSRVLLPWAPAASAPRCTTALTWCCMCSCRASCRCATALWRSLWSTEPTEYLDERCGAIGILLLGMCLVDSESLLEASVVALE